MIEIILTFIAATAPMFAPPAKRAKLCANGTTGYRTESKETYNPNKPCKNLPAHGHIFCPDCRREAGGYSSAVGKVAEHD